MRILFVAMSESVTTARWVAQLRGTHWDVHLFPSRFPVQHHPDLRSVTLHGAGLWRPEGLDPTVRVAGLWPWRRGACRVARVAERLRLERDRAAQLASLIRRLKPDIVHTLEMQHGGYLTLDARRRLRGRFPLWIYSSWGSDLYHFRHDPAHAARIREVLAACDGHMADCRRDVALAAEMGFRGAALGVFPGGGGYDVDEMARRRAPGPVSARRGLMVKGYQNERYGGRALIALQAVHRCADALRGYEIIVYGAAESVRHVAAHMAAVSGLRIQALERMPHAQVLDAFGRARIAMALGTTDGTPNALLEAMALGAFPVQSDTVSTAEWIAHGRNGLLVPAEDPHAVESALRLALRDDALVDAAAPVNAARVRERAEWSSVRESVLSVYESAGRIAGRHAPRMAPCPAVTR